MAGNDWCPCTEHNALMTDLIKALKAIEAHAAREEAAGAPAWVRAEHKALKTMSRMLVRGLSSHFQREEGRAA